MTKLRQILDKGINWPWMNKLIVLLALAAIISAVISLCYAYTHKNGELLSARWITIAGGFLAGAVLLQTMRRADAAEKAIVQKTFSDAVTHLGHERETVILGGIHSLIDLARENRDYRHKVFSILCAHIRTTTTAEKYCEKYENKPSGIIETLLNLLFRDEKYDVFPAKKEEYIADLNGAHLAGSELSKSRLEHANLQKANLRKAGLQEAKLQGANLQGAYLEEAFLYKAYLQGAYLQGADLREAFLKEAKLHGADLNVLAGLLLDEPGCILVNQPTNLNGAILTKAQLQGANLQEAKLQSANLQESEMQGAHMYRTGLSHDTQLDGSDLRGVSSQATESLDEFSMNFTERIRSRIGEETDLKGVSFPGDLTTFIKNSAARRGSYTEEEADQWIKEY